MGCFRSVWPLFDGTVGVQVGGQLLRKVYGHVVLKGSSFVVKFAILELLGDKDLNFKVLEH